MTLRMQEEPGVLVLPTHRWTREEYYRLGDLGFFDGKRVELIYGEVIDMAPQNNAHALSVVLANYALLRVFEDGYFIRVQLPLFLSEGREPEPDLAVIAGGPRDFTDHPGMAALVVEIADTTLKFDRQVKAKLYAEAKLPEYWIVNLVNRCVEVYRNPTTTAGVATYEPAKTFAGTEVLTPLAMLAQSIAVSELLP